jgi:hypothetical protein
MRVWARLDHYYHVLDEQGYVGDQDSIDREAESIHQMYTHASDMRPFLSTMRGPILK